MKLGKHTLKYEYGAWVNDSQDFSIIIHEHTIQGQKKYACFLGFLDQCVKTILYPTPHAAWEAAVTMLREKQREYNTLVEKYT